jgi:hypothetical protein
MQGDKAATQKTKRKNKWNERKQGAKDISTKARAIPRRLSRRGRYCQDHDQPEGPRAQMFGVQILVSARVKHTRHLLGARDTKRKGLRTRNALKAFTSKACKSKVPKTILIKLQIYTNKWHM